MVGCLIAMQAGLPASSATGGGSIVNFSSGAGVEGLAGRAAYSSAKAAVRLLSRTAALEWGADGIRVNCVCPFAMSPSLTEAVRAGTVDQAQLDAISPLGRPGDPELDIGAGVAFLLSDDARYVTGQTFMLDGGGLALCTCRHAAPSRRSLARSTTLRDCGDRRWSPTRGRSTRRLSARREWSSLTKCDGAANSRAELFG